jgi:hypothetical protein
MEDNILKRISACGLLDAPPASIGSELTYLASDRMGKLVDCMVHPTTKDVLWFATDEGVKRWNMDGRLHVG